MAGRPLQDSRQTNQSWMGCVVFSIGNAQMDSKVGRPTWDLDPASGQGSGRQAAHTQYGTSCTLGGILCRPAALLGPEKARPQKPATGMHTCMLCMLGTPCSV
jgi:hypothetical protein